MIAKSPLLLALLLSVSACGGATVCPTLDEDALADRIAARVLERFMAAAGGVDTAQEPDVTRVDIPARAGAPAQGPSDAAVTLVVFSDFQCPFCARLVPTLARVREHYGDRVRIVFRNYPLPFHPQAQLAAEAALEVQAQLGDEGFFRYHDALFEAAPAIERIDLERIARELPGIDVVRFRRALDTHVHAATVSEDMRALDDTGLSVGTPTSVVNGEVVTGAVPFEDFERVIDAALAR